MLDNELIAAVRSAILAGEMKAGIQGLPLKQAFQPTQQGANKQPTAYMYIIGHQRVGTPQRSDVWDNDLNKMVHTETQQYATTLQFSALSSQDPSNINSKTAGDIVNLIAYILQNEATIMALQEKGIGIQRITDIRNPPFSDDSGQNEFHPNFDSIFTHKQVMISETPVLESTEFQVLSV